jgi:hypothetical protein
MFFAAGSATLSDTSTSGTWINDEKLLKCSKELRNGDKVKLYNREGQAIPPCAIFTFHSGAYLHSATLEYDGTEDTELEKSRVRLKGKVQTKPNDSAAGGGGAAAASAPASASASEEAGSGAGTASSGAAARGEGVFSSQLLADVLFAALPTKVAMRDFVQAVKAKSEAFKSVQLSSKADGAYSNTQIAERIAECKPDQVTDGEGLLSWLIKVRAVVACA